MKNALLKDIKKDLLAKNKQDLVLLCLKLIKFKTENKEQIAYLLNYENAEESYITDIKEQIDSLFNNIPNHNAYLLKKNVRKILKTVKKYIRYSKQKETEVALIIHFCYQLKEVINSRKMQSTLSPILDSQKIFITKKISYLHEDLQFDYNKMLNEL